MRGNTITNLAFRLAGAAAVCSAAAHPRPRDAAGTAGCGSKPPGGLLPTPSKLTSGGKQRTYTVHLPSGYDATKPLPAVLGFAGSDTSGRFFMTDTGLNDPKYSADTIMIYPDGAPENKDLSLPGVLGLPAWSGPTYAGVSEAEDLQFIDDLLSQIRKDYCIDNSRIYATGISNGGGFVNTIACAEVGKNFAALAPILGSYFDEFPGYTDPRGDGGPYPGCQPARALTPMLFMAGGKDDKCPRDGATEGDAAKYGKLPPVADVIASWSKRNGGCGDAQPSSDDADVRKALEGAGDGVDTSTIHHTSYTCGGKEGALQYWNLDYLVHRWPSRNPNLTGLLGQELGGGPIEANQVIMDFFHQYSL